MNTSTQLAATTDAVSNLTGRMAHEFSNVLTIVLAKADLLADSLSPDDAALLADLEDLRRAARRGADLTDRMLSYARRHPLDLQDLDLATLVAATTPTLACLLPEGVELVTPTTGTRGRYRVRADEGAVQRVLLNLVANARDAMPTGGTVTITLERTSATDEQPESVSIVVSDTGSGIAPENRDRIFEPFFTTRDPGRGTGLGLSLVLGLMHQHCGTVSLEAQKVGAGVRVTFPALPVVEEDTGAAPHQGGLILIAEDEEMIRRSAKRVLERFGYTVLQAADGAEALERMIEAGHDLDLVISDIVMPHLDGLELHRKARARGYQTPFLFMSGYQRDEVWQTVADDATLDFLPKPWSVPELLARVHTIVERATSAPTATPVAAHETVQ
jgi:two-component system cell cycle sensor histidine kinase/response regulator CckA